MPPVEEVYSATSPSAESTIGQNMSVEKNYPSQTLGNQNSDDKQSSLSTNDEDNNVHKINENVEHQLTTTITAKENQKIVSKPDEIINGSRSENNLYLGKDEIDVPVDDSNEIVTGQVPDISEGEWQHIKISIIIILIYI